MTNPKKAYKTLYKVREINDLRDMLMQSKELFGKKNAFLHKPYDAKEYSPVSYNQLYDNVNELGTALWDIGLKDNKIIVIGENRYYWAITFLAVVNGLGVIIPIDKELPVEEIENLIKVSEASTIVYTNKISDKIFSINRENTPYLKTFITMDNDKLGVADYTINELLNKGQEFLEKGDRRFLEAELDPEEMKMIFFTSATTGLAKGVMHSHKAICENLQGMCSMVFIGAKDVFLSLLPLHHTYECTCGFLCPIYRGCSIAYCDGLKYVTKNMEEAKITMVLAVPLIIESIYKKIWKQAKKSGAEKKLKIAVKVSNTLIKAGIDIRKKIFKQIHDSLGGHMRLMISGAAPIDPKVMQGIKEFGINCIQGYGLTECAPIIALNRDKINREGAAGMVIPGVEIKVDKPNEEGIGELIAKGPNMMLGYYNNKELTDQVLIDDWYYTGDLGYVDKDKFVFITGRKKNMILTKNGKNVFPEELETYLCRSDFIAECMVWGKNDEKRNETFINVQILPDIENVEEKLGSGYSKEDLKALIKEEIQKVNEKMPVYKRITDFTLREKDFIKTTTRKIKRHMEKTE
jgi:long-chain acyl-CoA synthetase